MKRRTRRVVALVLAGGVGRRLGLAMPKQLVRVAGRTILEHTLAVFEAAPEVDEIIALMTPGHLDEARRLVAAAGFRKVSAVVEGGASRTESTWRALEAVGDRDDCDVLLHDAVRPLLEPRVITECVAALERHDAVEVAIPSSDTILVSAPGPGGSGEIVRDVPERAPLRRAQTPQGFRLPVIREAYRRAFADPGFDDRPATDDVGVVLRYLPDVPVYLVPGSERNLKITHPQDVLIANALFQPPVVPATASPAELRAALSGAALVVFGAEGPLAELARGHGAEVHCFSRAGGVRVEDFASVADALDLAAKESGRIDHVVAAAETPHTGRLADASGEAIAEAVTVGHLGPVTVARAAFGHLRATRGSLLLHGPAAGPPPSAVGSSTAAALSGLARALAAEWAGDGVRVNHVEAGRAGEPETARVALDVLVSGVTGQVIEPPPAG